MKIRSYDMTEVSTNRRTFSKRPLVVLFVVVLVPAAVASTVFAAAGNENPLDQILKIVQGIQTTLTGTDGSLAALQNDVTAIKSKTDNLPANTSATLRLLQASVDDIKASTGGLGPLNKFYSPRRLLINQATPPLQSATCTSTGPFLLHVKVQGFDAQWGAELITTPFPQDLWGETLGTGSTKTSSVVLGANAQDAITIAAEVDRSSNPQARIEILMVMQTTEGAIVACNFFE